MSKIYDREEFSHVKLAEGQVFTGQYLFSQRVKLNIARRYPGTDFGPCTIHYFIEANAFAPGNPVIGTSDLDFKLKQVKKGKVVRLVQEGAIDLGNGRRLRKWDVQYYLENNK